MEIDKILQVSQLYDFYAELLNEKQRDYVRNYYFEDLSLTEMSENYGISKQAISNSIKRSVQELEDYEVKLGLIALSSQRKFILNEILQVNKDEDVKNLLEHLIKLED